MTTDYIHHKHGKPYIGLFKPGSDTEGLELTRMQSFLDGGDDIFDVLEGLAANNDPKPVKINTIEVKTDIRPDTPKTFLSRILDFGKEHESDETLV